MSASAFDAEIRKYLSLLGSDEKKSILDTLKNLVNAASRAKKSEPTPPSIDYSKYKFPVSKIKFDRDEINER